MNPYVVYLNDAHFDSEIIRVGASSLQMTAKLHFYSLQKAFEDQRWDDGSKYFQSVKNESLGNTSLEETSQHRFES